MMLKKIASALVLLVLIVSCDLFFGLPRGRENPDDYAAIIAGPFAAANSPNSAVAGFTWKEPFPWQSSENTYEEVLLVWSTERFSLARSDRFLPSFESNSFSSAGVHIKEVPGLTSSDTLFVSLFAKTKEGWLAPQYAQTKVSAAAGPIGVVNEAPQEIISAKISTNAANPAATPTETVTNDSWLVVSYLDAMIPEEAIIVDCTLHLGVFFDGITLRIRPLVRDWYADEGAERLAQDGRVSQASGVIVTGAGGITDIDITRAMSAAHMSRTNAIVIDAPYVGDTLNVGTGAGELSLDFSYILQVD
jgi:hypothetical protein